MNYRPIDPQSPYTPNKFSIRKNREMLKQSIHPIHLRNSA